MNLPVVVVGGGGHGRVVVDALRAGGHQVLGVTDRAAGALAWRNLYGIELLGDDDVIDGYGPGAIFLANGIGGVATTAARRMIYERLVAKGYVFPAICHPSATISSSALLDLGTQVMAGAIVQVDCTIGLNSVVNTGARIDHDCRVGAHVHIGPGAVLCGGVRIDDGASIGAGAILRQGVIIGRDAIVGLGAAVVADVAAGATVVGVPARAMKAPR